MSELVTLRLGVAEALGSLRQVNGRCRVPQPSLSNCDSPRSGLAGLVVRGLRYRRDRPALCVLTNQQFAAYGYCVVDAVEHTSSARKRPRRVEANTHAAW